MTFIQDKLVEGEARLALLPLETERLQLWLYTGTPEEARRVRDYYQRNEEHFSESSPAPQEDFYTEEYWQRNLSATRQSLLDDQGCRLFMTLKGDPQTIVGHVSLSLIARGGFQACYLGYALDRDSVGRGLMHEGTGAAIKFAFGPLGLHRIMANHLPENLRSAAVLRRHGFVVEGLARDYLYINNQWRDHTLNALY